MSASSAEMVLYPVTNTFDPSGLAPTAMAWSFPWPGPSNRFTQSCAPGVAGVDATGGVPCGGRARGFAAAVAVGCTHNPASNVTLAVASRAPARPCAFTVRTLRRAEGPGNSSASCPSGAALGGRVRDRGEPVVEELRRVAIGPPPRRRDGFAQHHRQHGVAVPPGRAGHALAGRVGVPGLDPDGTRVAFEQSVDVP